MLIWADQFETTLHRKGAGKHGIWKDHHDILKIMKWTLPLSGTNISSRAGSISGGDVARFFMKNLVMDKHMFQGLPCPR